MLQRRRAAAALPDVYAAASSPAPVDGDVVPSATLTVMVVGVTGKTGRAVAEAVLARGLRLAPLAFSCALAV